MKYELTARQVPSLFTLLPAAIVLAAVGGEHWKAVQSLLAIAGGVGAQIVLAKFARYVGQRQQDRLWMKWGGNPTALLLRHCDTTLPLPTKERYRAFLSNAIGIALPTQIDENADERMALQVYESCVDYLRSATRSDNFPLVMAENINYGLARNLYGLRPFGIVICVLSFVLLAWLSSPWASCGTPNNSILPIAGAIIVAIILLSWIFWVRENWVERCSYSYARALLEACERLK